jgi:serine phosphatase RsbU (regulator of sigma subunit)
MAAVLLVALLARRASLAVESSRQHERILQRLERFGRAVLSALPSMENLRAALAETIPGMFPPGRLVIWLLPDEILHLEGENWEPPLLPLLPWLVRNKQVASFTAHSPLPWAETGQPHPPVVIAPILDPESGVPVGGIYLELFTLAQPWDRRTLAPLEPAVQSLAAQVASVLGQIENYRRSLELERIEQELRLAGAIQASLLPIEYPRLPGWQLAVTIEPAEETAGDFFDIIPMGDGKLGLVVADVMDKGIGPALYMAISRTLIRTYTLALGDRPEMVFYATNERILKDTRANLFVSAFFAVLDPQSGQLLYANAGHLPPLLLRGSEEPPQVELLKPTGIPIGITLDTSWSKAQTTMAPGDVLILYTDGIPEAQNAAHAFFGQEKLLEICRQHHAASAEELQAIILQAVHAFRGDQPPSDDITLMVLRRDLTP